MLDISPTIEQAIIAQAQQQGVTVNQYLSSVVFQEPFLDSDLNVISFDDEEGEFIKNLLDNPPPPTPAMQRLLALRGN